MAGQSLETSPPPLNRTAQQQTQCFQTPFDDMSAQGFREMAVAAYRVRCRGEQTDGLPPVCSRPHGKARRFQES